MCYLSTIQLFALAPMISDVISEIEAEASSEFGFAVSVTSLKQKQKMTIGKSGDLKGTGMMALTLRPGLKGNKPLKVTLKLKHLGVLR